MNNEQKIVYLDGTEKVVYIHDLLDPTRTGNSDFFRMTGRTKRTALKCIHDAMARPNHYIPILDHHDTPRAHNNLAGIISKLITVLNCQGLCMVEARQGRRADWKHLEHYVQQYGLSMKFLIFDTEANERAMRRQERHNKQLKFY